MEKLKKLRVLELSKNLITEIKGIKALSNLQWLNLQNNWELSQLNEATFEDIRPVAA